jgi:hypothetical protein
MFQEAFEKLELEEVALILDQVNPDFDGINFDPVETTIMAQDVPFYPGFRLLDIADYTSMPPLQRFVLYKRGKHVILNSQYEPIYAFNKELPIKLDEDTIMDYVRFFFAHVRGKHGRFILCENVDDINWKDDPPPQARKTIGKMIIPLTLEERAEGVKDFHLKTCMMFKDALFKSDVTVKPDGTLSLSNEERLIEDMPVLDDTFGQ